ncbi:Clavaminate synthase-like protein [Stereum hirsutum FP-91666 SS1]|uniref:Clavaminate synthase-like protein n=1 Tax=Stereum hirsutum (strain FP-91666) TaxID=721885 RepID=UPI000440A3C2|nr:Clavaminate synthase-like protein [Stereum hirsutum FP-91666 SS1]EIM87631.1 Clavaminate synthase-like protein [Stereum hirsutum FP-91666 SS1]
MPGTTFPPFPDDVATVPLLIIDYELIKTGNVKEIDTLWNAATQIGFWYLKNHGVDEEVNKMFDMGVEMMDLPLEEKIKYDKGAETGVSAGYKALGASAIDETGARDHAEFLNIAQDDALSYPIPARRTYPGPVNARMESTIVPFIRKSAEINLTLLGVLNDRLGLPEGTLGNKHLIDRPSGSEARCIKSPPTQEILSEKASIGAHTDFGSLSFLHNRLGGLQVLPPGTNTWKYVKLIPGHAICNIGDALAIFSAGILRSNVHRVLPPPKRQASFDRWSLVFFTRPENSVILEPLTVSQMVKDAKASAPEGRYDTGTSAGDWFKRRVMNRRIKNRKGPETWKESQGTEHTGGLV